MNYYFSDLSPTGWNYLKPQEEETYQDKMPENENSMNRTSGGSMPLDEIPVNQMPMNRMPANGMPMDQMPMNQMPANGMPMDQMPMNQMPANGMPMDQMPMNQMPVNGMPMDRMPMNQMPMNQMPANGMPMDQMPMNQMPANGMPMDQMPVNQMPANGMPMEQMPMNQMPANGMPMEQMPMNQMPPVSVPIMNPEGIMREERLSWQDGERLRSLYPRIGQEVQQCVGELCDKLEYEGSRMFDEYPDRTMIRRMAEDIYDRVKDVYPEEEPEPNQELFSMQCPGPGCRPTHKNWMGDLIQIMLLDEMYRRRCRHRRCRRYW
ncbi:MAG: hypothetical protein PHR92_02090 [Lachnospiraceae bacterium]|nr:hypothetical protein [Lachnospiraceae bacterium]